MTAHEQSRGIDGVRRADGGAARRPGRRGRGDPRDAYSGRAEAVSARPLHAVRARGAVAPVADGSPCRPGRPVPRDRASGADVDRDGDACRAVAPPRRGRLPARPRAHAAESRSAGAVSTSGFTRAGEDGRLSLAVPAKGRMAESSLRLCADAGLSFETTERSLLVPCANAPVDLLLVRPSDLPEHVQAGGVDVGITGANLVAEAQARVEALAELGFARCTLEAAVPEDATQQAVEDLDGLRVATAYPVSTRRLLAERGVEAELVPVSGSV